ncbi:MAG: galactokinase family protein, partial [Firmicutes bacterium]|nr:galactokinase family protein [Bacillota bacterium]
MEDISIRFKETFFKGPERLFSAPGRIEIGGNHTDHQNGRVLAAAVSLSAFAAVSRGEEGLIRLVSQGYGETRIELSDLQPRPDERARFSSLVRGTAASVIKKCREKGGDPVPFG